MERALLSAGAEVLSGLLRDDPAMATVPAGGKVPLLGRGAETGQDAFGLAVMGAGGCEKGARTVEIFNVCWVGPGPEQFG